MRRKTYIINITIFILTLFVLFSLYPKGPINSGRYRIGEIQSVAAGNPAQFGCGLITINFDQVQPGTYQELTVSGITFHARQGNSFQIAPLQRTNISPPYALIVSGTEMIDITFDKDYGIVSGLGITYGLVNQDPTPSDSAVFGFTTYFPQRPYSLPVPSNATVIEYQPSPPATEISIEAKLTKADEGIYDGVKLKLLFGRFRGSVDDPNFHGQPGFGFLTAQNTPSSGAFFDNLIIERSMGSAMPYEMNGSCEDKIDLIFIPDQSYGTRSDWFDKFFGDLSNLIERDFKKNDYFQVNRNKFNFYYLVDKAKIYTNRGSCLDMADPPAPYKSWFFDDATWGRGFNSDFPFTDGAAIMEVIFTDDGGGCPMFSNGKYLFFFPSMRPGIFFHEAGHAFFNLSDEYPIENYDNRTYWQAKPYPNIWYSIQGCIQEATNEGWNPNDCTEFVPGWWKIDPIDAMFNTYEIQYGPACSRNVKYYFGNLP